MNIIYKHKETGFAISLKELKGKSDLTFQIHTKLIVKPQGDKSFFRYPNPNIKEYYAKDIPFSDDFEIIIEDNPYDFDICEIYTLLNALSLYPYATSHELKLKDKLVKIYKKLKGWD